MISPEQLAKRVRIRYRRSSPLLKCVVLVAILLCVAALLTLRFTLNDVRSRTRDLQQQAAVLEQENRDLETDIARSGSVKSVRRIAERELDLVDPHSEFFTPEQQK